MSELSAKSRALLDAARSARPTSAARERMGLALVARIGAAAALAPPPAGAGAPGVAPAPPAVPPIVPAPLAGAAVAATVKTVVLGVVLGVVAAGAVALRPKGLPPFPPAMHGVAPRSSTSARAVESAAMPAPDAEVALPAELPDPRVAELSAPAAERPRAPLAVAPLQPSGAVARAAPRPARRATEPKREPPPPVGAISLGDETALMLEAQRALKQGDGARAVAVLDELAARHPAGVLREERLAARVFGLCAAGRVEEAREAGQRFLREMPASVQADRVRASCAFAPNLDR